MGIRPYCLCLSLLAALGASGAPLTADPLPHLDGVLVPSSSSVSTLLIDVETLTPSICDALAASGTGGNLVKCAVKVLNDNNVIPLRRMALEPMPTPCGTVQPDLILYLAPFPVPPPAAEGDGDPGAGVSPQALTISTLLHLTNLETGQTADIQMHLGTGLEDSGAPPANALWGDGRLYYNGWRGPGKVYYNNKGELIGEFDGCIPTKFDQMFQSRYENVGTEVCTVCPPETELCDAGGGGAHEDGCDAPLDHP